MQMVKKSFIVFIILWMAILILMPKKAFYYKLEEALAKHEIILNEENIEEGLFSLCLKQVSVYFKGIHIASIEEVQMDTFLFYNRVALSAVHIDDSLKTMVPQETQKALATYSILSPLELFVEAEGSFGSMVGNIDLNKRNVYLDFNESKNIEMLKPQLKKSEKGWVYETSF